MKEDDWFLIATKIRIDNIPEKCISIEENNVFIFKTIVFHYFLAILCTTASAWDSEETVGNLVPNI